LPAAPPFAKEAIMVPCRHRAVALLPFVLTLVAASPVSAAKWAQGCTLKQKFWKAGSGGVFTQSKFVHIGHDIVYRVKTVRGVPWHGGFSTAPDGNTVQITFYPVNGDPIPLPPFTVTAVDATTLRFPAPDTRPLLGGRMVVGPMVIQVTSANGFEFRGKRPTILPPMNDVSNLAQQGSNAVAYGAPDFAEDVWVPLTFSTFGTTWPLSCPVEMTPVLAFAVDFVLDKGPDGLLPHASFATLKKTKIWLGDVELDGTNFYGTILKTPLNLVQLRRGAFTLCGLNDTVQVVLQIKLKAGASKEKSHLPSDGSPVPLKFRNISTDTDVSDVLPTLTEDSFMQPCPPQ
jgi:hypothetical protein